MTVALGRLLGSGAEKEWGREEEVTGNVCHFWFCFFNELHPLFRKRKKKMEAESVDTDAGSLVDLIG